MPTITAALLSLLVAVAPAIAGTGAGTGAGSRHGSGGDDAPLAKPVVVMPAEADDLPGVTRPAHEATLGVPYDALLAEVRVAEGDRVRRGEVIAVLDDRVSRAALRVSETEAGHTAAIDRAEIVLARAEQALDRAERAHKAGASNDEQVSEARKNRDVAAADLRFANEEFDKARAQLEMTRAQFEEHQIRATFDGVVVRVHADPGEVLGPGEPIAEVISLEHALADLYLPADRALALRRGDRVALALQDPVNAVLAGCVRYAEPRIDPISRACRVVFELEAPPSAIPAGVFITTAGRAPDEGDLDRLERLAALRTDPDPDLDPEKGTSAFATVDPDGQSAEAGE